MNAAGNLTARRRETATGRRGLSIEDAIEACMGRGLLSQSEAKFALERQSAQEAALARRAGHTGTVDPVELLVSFRLAPPGRKEPLETEEVLDAVAHHFRIPRAHIDPVRLNAEAIVHALPRPFARRHAMLVLDPCADPVPLAAADPFDADAVESVRQRLGRAVEVRLAARAEILRLIYEIYGFRSSVAAAERDLNSLPDLQNLEQFFRMRSDGEVDSSDGHIVRAVDHLLRYALDQRASDIHVEPKRERSVVRLRIDGILHSVHTFSRRVHSALVSRIKTLARMDIAEKRLPQDGRIKTEYEGKTVELRVSSLPVAFGEKMVLRIFDPSVLEQDLPDLGLESDDLETAESFLAQPHGLILVTGPTGSGKTTTLYSALKRLANGERNVSTVEDPIENVCDEFNQVGVHPGIGLTFASALRTLLRQDPDVIMVGEIRDSETAKMAIQAALTGHLVLSTLHTNDAPGGVGRLLDMGVEPFLLASTLLGIVAQRLVRCPCPHCSAEAEIHPEPARALGIDLGSTVVLGKGCPRCRHTGYRGRTGLFEILKITPAVADAVHRGLPTDRLRALARSQGMRTLSEAGAQQVLRGQTTPQEVLAVAPPGEWHAPCVGGDSENNEIPGAPNLRWASVGG